MQEIEIPYYKKLWFGISIVALSLIITTIVIGSIALDNCESKRDEITRNAISALLHEQSQLNTLLPNVLVLNISEKEKCSINDSIKKQITKYLVSKYSQSNKWQQVAIHPYANILEKNNNTAISQDQIEDLKKHILFLVNNCEKNIEDSKREIDTEISKINTWVTIWIGVFGILGIFIPIVVNLKSFETLKDIETKADNAVNKIIQHKDDLNAISGIKTSVDKALKDIEIINTTLPNLSSQSLTASQNAQLAVDKSELNSKILVAFGAIGKLKKLEKIIFLNKENPIQIINTYFSSILNTLRRIDGKYEEDFYSELIEELKERLYELSATTIISSRQYTEALSKFAVFIDGKLQANQPLTNTDHQEIISHFESMLIIFQ